MAWRRSVVYATVDNAGSIRFHYSPRPQVDALWHRERGVTTFIPLHPPLPPVWALEACHQLQRRADEAGVEHPDRRATGGQPRERRAAPQPRHFSLFGGWRSGRRDKFERDAHSIIKRLVRGTRYSLAAGGYRWSARLLDGISADVSTRDDTAWPADDDLDAVAELLEGRLLGELELLQLTERAGLELDSSVEDCLAALSLLGRVRRRPGMERTAFGEWRCSRCGDAENVSLVDCAACGETLCPECDECRSLGVVRGCTLLYAGRVSDPIGVGKPVPFRTHELTPAQGRAADKLEQFVRTEGGREALVWAVCGAGKTELCFPAVARVLGAGGRVLFAIPRRDIVRELGQRLRSAFPGVDTEVLHGGEGRVERRGLAPGTLTVATTHQVLRFERAFDLVILDEVDAFPYRSSPMLQRAVERALRPGGHMVRMSATPSRGLIRRADKGTSVLITVPVRHHGKPLPVPALHKDRMWRGSGVRVNGLSRREFSLHDGLTMGEGIGGHDGGAMGEGFGAHGVGSMAELADGHDGAAATSERTDFHENRVGMEPPTVRSVVRSGEGSAEHSAVHSAVRSDRPQGVSRRLLQLIGESLGGQPPARVLVFVPDVASTEAVGRALLEALSKADFIRPRTVSQDGSRAAHDSHRSRSRSAPPRVLWSHASDPERDQKLRALQEGQCEVFVATTILERGVTVPDVDVIVLFADRERVFTESTLVQMAGRVGRSTDRPTGRVHFVGERISPAMKRAVEQIERMNTEAAQLGLLRD